MNTRLSRAVAVCVLLAAPADTPRAAANVTQDMQQDTQQAETIQLGGSIKREITGASVQEYRVAVGVAGTYLRFTIKFECCAAVSVELVQPDGTRAHQIIGDFQFWPHTLSYVAESAGVYRVRVRRQNPEDGDGAYVIRLEEVATATPRHRDRFRAEQMVEAARAPIDSGSDPAVRGAIEALQAARALYRGAGDLRGETDVLELTAEAHMSLGELPLALDDQRARIALLDAVGDRKASAYTLNRMRFYAQMLGDFQAMLDLSQEALEVFRSIGEPDGIVEGLMGVGNAYRGLNDRVHAAQAFDEADAIDPSPTRWTTNINLSGQAYMAAGLLDKAIERFETEAEISRRTGRVADEQWDYNRLVELYARTGRRDKALEYMGRVLDYVQSQPGRPNLATLTQLGVNFTTLGDREKAREYLDQALAPGAGAASRSGPASRDVASLGNAFAAIGEHEKALRCYEETLAYIQWLGGAAGREARLPARMAASERDLGRLDAAREHIQLAMTKFEALRGSIASPAVRSDYFATIQDVYDLYIDLLMRSHAEQPSAGHAAAALNISERARGRSLMELLTEARVNIRQGVDQKLLDRELALRRRIALLASQQAGLSPKERAGEQAKGLAKEIEARTAEQQLVEGQVRAASPRYAALTAPTPLTVTQIQQQVLDADTLLLEYALGDARSYLWVVSRESLTGFVLPARATIEDQARRVYELLTARNRRVEGESDAARQARIARAQTDYPGAAGRLTEMILQPAALLLGRKRLLVVAQGALQYIPFAALPDPGSDTAATPPPPLLAAHEIVYAPSASVVAVMRQETRGRTAAPRALAVIADPVFDKDDARVTKTAASDRTVGPSVKSTGASRPRADLERSFIESGMTSDGRLPRLSFSRREAVAIAATVPAGQAFEAFDFLASKDTATSRDLSQYRILHFATHGMLDSARATLSGLVLSLVDERGAPQDGFLRLNDVFNLRLPADLVVLSACQTALGQDVRGEGLVGLARAFMYAGAPRVAASLWKVDDAATASLMVRFYGDMLGRDLRPAEALRSAQLAMIQDKRWRDPFYWAAFELQGEWK